MSKLDPAQPVYQITLRARPDRVPAPKRVAQLLKHALRCLGLVCVGAVELKPPGGATGVAREAAGDQGPAVGAERGAGPS